MEAPEYWDWHDTKKWGGLCGQQVMQSPINVVAPTKGRMGNTGEHFMVDYSFEKNVNVVIKTRGPEIIARFLDFAGAFKFIYRRDGTMLSFHPIFLSFRFPAEHLINGYRLDGEIVIVCNEVTPKENKVKYTTLLDIGL